MNNKALISLIYAADRILRKTAGIILMILVLFLVNTIYDIMSYTMAGIGGVEYHSFSELAELNPDVVAWIRLDGTNIDHPIVQGKDNYEYLGKDFNGNDYAGGSIFLDARNSRDMSDRYMVIHGHHMSGGAMFGDLAKYRNREFFDEHETGELLTPDSKYDITVAGMTVADAYDGSIYNADPGQLNEELLDRCKYRRKAGFRESDKLLALSTCSGDMSDDRVVVYVRARYAGKNDE